MVTDSEVAYFIAMFIVFVLAVSFSIGWAKADGIKPLSDKFELGYIEDVSPETPVEIQVADEYDELKDLERQVKIAKLKKQLQDLNKPPEPKQPQKKAPKKQLLDLSIFEITSIPAFIHKHSIVLGNKSTFLKTGHNLRD